MKKSLKRAAALSLSGLMAMSVMGTAPVLASDSEEVTIRVMLWDRGDAAPNTTIENNTETAWLQETMKELYNINVEYVAVPRSTSDDVLNVMMSGGDAPDIVFTYDQSIFYKYATLGGLADVTEAMETYGDNIQEYLGNIQNMANIDGVQLGVMKRRGAEFPRHMSYIRQDWLDALEMDVPTTKEELIKYLYAVKEQNPGNVDNVIPWAMSGRLDTEKMYLNFIGSYVTLESEKDAYVYSEAYMAVAPGAIDGIRQMNTLYNDGIISQDFATDTSEDAYKAAVSSGAAGFFLDDRTTQWGNIEILNAETGGTTFVPVQCFDLEDGTYRMPFEPEFGMYIMIPKASEDKVDACIQYLNWLADPVNAENAGYTPDHEQDENGVPIALKEERMKELGYKTTSDDFNIVNAHFEYTDSKEGIVASWTNVYDFESQEWFESIYDTDQIGKFRFPTYSYIPQAEADYGSAIKTQMIEYVYRLISCSPEEFDSLQTTLYNDMVTAGLQDILDERAEYYDSIAE